MMPNWRSAAGSSGASRSTSRYSFSALSYCPAAKAALARDRSCSLVGSSLVQPAFAMAVKQSAKINPLYPEPRIVLDGKGEDVGRRVLIIDMLLHLSEFNPQSLGNDCALSAVYWTIQW